MSSLWKMRLTVNVAKIMNNKRPSSKCDNDSLSGPALDPNTLYNKQIPFVSKMLRSIERISLFTFFCKKIRGSMTVEAALVLPLFLLFFVNLGCSIEMMRLHGNLELALWQVGNNMSVYGHVWNDLTENGDASKMMEELGDVAFSYQYVKRAVLQFLGEDYLNNAPLTDGADGLQFLESEIFTGGDCFEIVMTYPVSPWISMEGILSFRMANRYYGHIWNGYGIPGAEPDKITQTVYLAENAEVYHVTQECTHLLLTIREVPFESVGREKNENGGKYTACELCVEGDAPNQVYVGVEGDRYHYERGCSGLKRTYYSVLITEAEGYRPCSRCGK